MDWDDSERNRSYMGSDIVNQLCRAGRKNLTQTHPFFKVAFVLLFVASVLYLVGFVSPYWVADVLDGEGAGGTDDDNNVSTAVNSSGDGGGGEKGRERAHSGVWEKCVRTEGGVRCTVFKEDLDSVVAMLGCVGGLLLTGACCWTGLACVRKPVLRRYVTAAVVATIGGIFGLVCVFVFVGIQGRKAYSWAFALTLAGSVLGLSAAACDMLGLGKTLAGGVSRAQSDTTLDNNANVIPEIIVTKPTPRKKRRRRQQRTKGNPQPAGWARATRHTEHHVHFLSAGTPWPLSDSKSKADKKEVRFLSKQKRVRRKTPVPQTYRAQMQQLTRHNLRYAGHPDSRHPLLGSSSPTSETSDSVHAHARTTVAHSGLSVDEEVHAGISSSGRPGRWDVALRVSADETGHSSSGKRGSKRSSKRNSTQHVSLGLADCSGASADPQPDPTPPLFRTPQARRRSEIFYTPEIHRTPRARRTSHEYLACDRQLPGQIPTWSLHNAVADGAVDEGCRGFRRAVYMDENRASFHSFKPAGGRSDAQNTL